MAKDNDKSNIAADSYRAAAERDLRRRVDAMSRELGEDVSDGENAAHAETAAADNAAPDMRESIGQTSVASNGAPQSIDTETAERILRALGADRRRAKALARLFGSKADAETLGAIAAAVGHAQTHGAAGGSNIHGGHRQRLRDAARCDRSLDSFSDIEILETLLSFVVPQRNTNPLAHRLLDRFGSLIGVFRASRDELYAVSGMTRNAAELLGILTVICLWNGAPQIRLAGHADAAAFFGAMYLGGASDGTRVAYLDGGFGLAAVEKLAGLDDVKPIVGSVCRYSANYVIVSRRESGLFPANFEPTENTARLAETLRSVGARLLDCFVFTDCGYYTLSDSRRARGTLEYIFVPTFAATHAPELVKRLID